MLLNNERLQLLSCARLARTALPSGRRCRKVSTQATESSLGRGWHLHSAVAMSSAGKGTSLDPTTAPGGTWGQQ